ncbi:nitroreductase [Spongiibacter marinus]|uniref:nitroreductase n=1 Tax=Spongiibacter marinus TaxID=354246 RepID=UPI000426E5AF|nr:nitroreductase [Spongiibacter marinus]
MNHAQAFYDVLKRRRSVRAFRSQPIAEARLQNIFRAAQQAPSNCNTQPWLCAVVSGERLEVLRTAIPQAFTAGQWTMDFPYDGQYQGVYKERQYQAAADLYSAMGIAREDKAGRNEQFMQNFTFFGAPHVAFIFLPESFGLREAADCGMYAQSLMLALAAEGLASCPQTALSFNADLVREVLGIDAENKLLFGISFGEEDTDAAVNNCRTQRDTSDNCLRFFS